MKFSAQEEYGLRCLLQVAKARGESVTIPEVAQAEGLSQAYVGKLMTALRQSRFVKSARGKTGGYVLVRTPQEIAVAEVLGALGGRLYDPAFCDEFTGIEKTCTRSIDCSIRSLWRSVQGAVDVVLAGITLEDLLIREAEMDSRFQNRFRDS